MGLISWCRQGFQTKESRFTLYHVNEKHLTRFHTKGHPHRGVGTYFPPPRPPQAVTIRQQEIVERLFHQWLSLSLNFSGRTPPLHHASSPQPLHAILVTSSPEANERMRYRPSYFLPPVLTSV
ncbi:hypothetical protein E2C01_043581 [Portunus trituberculatus]|uniref:Uncharacterized protein n=1 Tax=Portunus trituberculatus TaxID=210409 RepID=A0A5B7FW34_PORTR|nr:hypothetical protein [Portunus trituberculatus]